jgi:hypothetical protein
LWSCGVGKLVLEGEKNPKINNKMKNKNIQINGK